MHVQVGNASVTTLAELNTALAALANGPGAVAAGDLDTTGAPSAAEIDQAIANCDEEIYDYMDRGDLITAVNTELAPLVANPRGYDRLTNSGYAAYVNDGGFQLDNQAQNLLVDAANNLGEARHQTSDARGIPNAASAYIHAYGNNALFAFSDNGRHRETPMVTVLATGAVNDGTHVFN